MIFVIIKLMIDKRRNLVNNKIAIIGIGGAGAKTISRIKERVNVTAIIIDTEDEGITADKSIILNQKDNQKITNTGIVTLNSVIAKYDILILCAGLGGETGTALSPVFTKLAKKQNKFVAAVLYKPFKFEGSVRNRRAENSTAQIGETADISVEISNDMIAKVSPKRTSFSQAFSAADDILFEIITIITNEAENDNFETVKNTIVNKIKDVISKSKFILNHP